MTRGPHLTWRQKIAAVVASVGACIGLTATIAASSDGSTGSAGPGAQAAVRAHTLTRAS